MKQAQQWSFRVEQVVNYWPVEFAGVNVQGCGEFGPGVFARSPGAGFYLADVVYAAFVRQFPLGEAPEAAQTYQVVAEPFVYVALCDHAVIYQRFCAESKPLI